MTVAGSRLGKHGKAGWAAQLCAPAEQVLGQVALATLEVEGEEHEAEVPWRGVENLHAPPEPRAGRVEGLPWKVRADAVRTREHKEPPHPLHAVRQKVRHDAKGLADAGDLLVTEGVEDLESDVQKGQVPVEVRVNDGPRDLVGRACAQEELSPDLAPLAQAREEVAQLGLLWRGLDLES